MEGLVTHSLRPAPKAQDVQVIAMGITARMGWLG